MRPGHVARSPYAGHMPGWASRTWLLLIPPIPSLEKPCPNTSRIKLLFLSPSDLLLPLPLFPVHGGRQRPPLSRSTTCCYEQLLPRRCCEQLLPAAMSNPLSQHLKLLLAAVEKRRHMCSLRAQWMLRGEASAAASLEGQRVGAANGGAGGCGTTMWCSGVWLRFAGIGGARCYNRHVRKPETVSTGAATDNHRCWSEVMFGTEASRTCCNRQNTELQPASCFARTDENFDASGDGEPFFFAETSFFCWDRPEFLLRPLLLLELASFLKPCICFVGNMHFLCWTMALFLRNHAIVFFAEPCHFYGTMPLFLLQTAQHCPNHGRHGTLQQPLPGLREAAVLLTVTVTHDDGDAR